MCPLSCISIFFLIKCRLRAPANSGSRVHLFQPGKHHRKILKKKVSDDAIVTIERNVDNVETNTVENTQEENEIILSVDKGASVRSTRSNSIFVPFRMSRLKCLSEEPSYDILDTEFDADSKVVIKRRSSMWARIMDDV